MSGENLDKLMVEKMKFMREMQKLTAEQCALIANIDVFTYRRIEAGEATPSEEIIERLCAFCGIAPIWLTNHKKCLKDFEYQVYTVLNRRKHRRVRFMNEMPQFMGKKLHEIRKAHSLSQYQMASILKVTRESYAAYERNVSIVNQSILEIICEFFSVRQEDLLNDLISVEIFTTEYLNKIHDPRRSSNRFL